MRDPDPDVVAQLLREYSRALTHMRNRHADRRFALILGAGVGRGLGFPNWPELLDRLAKHKEVAAPHITHADEDSTYRSQILFEHFKSKVLKGIPPQCHNIAATAYDIEVQWKRIVHECLYRDVRHDLIDDRDHYLATFLPIVRSSPLTITYNFDDSLERMLHSTRPDDEETTSRGYTTVWSPNPQFEAKSAVVYHPNGFMPWKLTEQPSEELVLLEESFADQLIATSSGHYALLANHVSQMTNLLVGLSLDDPTLRHVLHRSARTHPGHFQYYVKFVREGEPVDRDRQRAEFDSNFKVHNLITLFLDSERLAALGFILSQDSRAYEKRLNELGLPLSYRYFLAGSVGVGKTTAVSQLRSLRVLEEWLEPLPETMTVDPRTLTPNQLEKIDDWVDDQIERKNSRLVLASPGIDVIDRAPLDAFAYVRPEHWASRAQALRRAISQPNPGRTHCKGHLILLTGEPSIIEPRARRVMRSPGLDGVKRQQLTLEWVYPSDRPGVTVIDTREHTAPEVVRMIADVIHRRKYSEFDFDARLLEIEHGVRIPPEAPQGG